MYKHTYLVLLLIIGSLAAITILYKQQIYRQLNTWNLLPQPEPFTELYLEDHLRLPYDMLPDNEYMFRFTTHNVEYTDMTYDYVVTATLLGETVALDTGSFPLAHNEMKTTTEKISLDLPEATYSARVKVEVQLLNKRQSVHFWSQIHE